MKHKIKAYTLIEVTVAMLLSAICITICYTAYSLITSYYSSFQNQNEKIDRILTLKHVLDHDFEQSAYALKSETGLVLYQDSIVITYAFQPEYITRKLNQLHTDTFKINTTLPKSYFEQQEVLDGDTLDELKFDLISKNNAVTIQVKKQYSAENLFH